MSKFLDKKEQVIDFKLTTYGNYLLSIGNFKPTYYTFLDDNVVYDSAYFDRTGEVQNEIHKRIKEDTQYIESLVLFEELGKNNIPSSELNYFPGDITPTQKATRIDEFRMNSIIGDSFVGENKQKVPAWKIVSLRSDISSSSPVDNTNSTRVPQINITASYFKKTIDRQDYANKTFNTSNDRVLEAVSDVFADGKRVYVEMSDVLVYIEETNTEVLNENFDIEIFEVQQIDSSNGQKLIKKFFQNKKEQIVDGIMVSSNEQELEQQELTLDAVENYFYLFTDNDVDEETACKLANDFNKQTYYVDLDFDCDKEITEDLFFDIYGSETEAEICQT
tara:strand:- start:713 stop:1714 length:1002 start_codon:yes stop_codon:yes gene_type:complete